MKVFGSRRLARIAGCSASAAFAIAACSASNGGHQETRALSPARKAVESLPDGDTAKKYCDAASSSLAEAWCALYCFDALIYCVDIFGNPIDDELAPTLQPGEHLLVRVVGDPRSRELGGRTMELQSEGMPESPIRVFPESSKLAIDAAASQVDATLSAASAALEAGDATSDAGASAPVPADGGGHAAVDAGQAEATTGAVATGSSGAAREYDDWALLAVEVRVPDGVRTVRVRYKLVASQTRALVSENAYTFNVELGEHYIEAGFMVPFVINGDRKVDDLGVPGTSERRLQIKEDLHVTFALTVLVFPFGVDAEQGIFSDNVDAARREDDLWRFLSPFGISAGTSLDFSSATFREWYLGFAWQPTPGISLGAGAAFLRGEFIPEGFSEGMLIQPGTAPPETLRYMMRPYFGVTLSPEILESVAGAFSRVDSLAPARRTRRD
jgi:hypothetical protein